MPLPLNGLRIVYFSSRPSDLTNGIAGMLQQAGAEVVLLVLTPGLRSRPTEAYKEVVANKLPGVDVLITSRMQRLTPMIRPLEPDLIFVTGFPWRLPVDLLSVPRFGSLNTHPAALPKYRGPDPLFWHLANGEPEIALTVHRMEAEFDTGPILAQRAMSIDPDWYYEDLAEHLGSLGPDVVMEAFAAALSGRPGTPQPEEGASYAPIPGPSERLLDWNRPASELRNLVRAWGKRGAHASIDGRQWLVRRARALSDASTPGEVPVGSIVDLPPHGQAVRTASGLLLLEEAEPLSTPAH